MNNDSIVVALNNVTKTYRRGAEEIRAVDNVSLQVRSGEFLAITGQSGSGKTTLLQLIGAMDTPTSGNITVSGRELVGQSDMQLTQLRRHTIGFVFQQFGLLPTLSVAENVALPALSAGEQTRARVQVLLQRMGLEHRQNHRPSELSGGEMQRTAIARSLINNPKILLADEPTGNLDSTTGAEILSLFQELRTQGLTIVVVTHNDLFACATDRKITLQDGRIVGSP